MPIDAAVFKSLLPELILVLYAVLVLIGGTWNRTKLGWATLAVVAFALSSLVLGQASSVAESQTAWAGAGGVLHDALSVSLRRWAVFLGALFAIFSTQSRQQRLYPELLASLVFVFVGLMIVSSAGDLVLLFVGLELISIPTYVLLFIGRESRTSDESAAKYFFLSILSSAMMLYGFATLYGLAGSTNLAIIQASLNGPEPLAFAGFFPVAVGLILVGMCFKIAAVPFHFYAPDVYQGTTNLNAALLAVVPKIAGVVGLVRVIVVALPRESDFTWKLVVVLAVATMTLGNVAALWQRHLRRLLAYSSIAHAGYLMIGLAAALGVGGGTPLRSDAVAAMVFYVVAYAAATIGTFAAVAYLSDDDQRYSGLDELAGMGRAHPIVGGIIAICMFSLAGIPPLAGFWGKFALFRSALDAGLAPESGPNVWYLTLCALGVVNAAIAAAYYLRVIATLYFQPGETDDHDALEGNAGAGLVAIVSALTVLFIGLFAGGSLGSAQEAAQQLWATNQAVEALAEPEVLSEHLNKESTGQLLVGQIEHP